MAKLIRIATGEESSKRIRRNAKLKPLPWVEWSFHRVAPEQRKACLWYEYMREALSAEPGDDFRWPPWLGLPKDEHERQTNDYCVSEILSVRASIVIPIIRKLDPVMCEKMIKEGLYPNQPQIHPVLLEIDWSASDKKLKRDFAKWLDAQRNDRGSPAWTYKGAKGNRGPRKDTNEQLVDLAIYRAKNAGYDPKGMTELLARLLDDLSYRRVINHQRAYEASKRVEKLLTSAMPI